MNLLFSLSRKSWSVPVVALLAAGLLASEATHAACSPHRNKIVINEIRVSIQGSTPAFAELKILDPSVVAASNNFASWKLAAYGGSNGNKGEANVSSVYQNIGKNDCGETSVWFRIPDADLGNKLNWNGNSAANLNLVLWDSSAGTKGQIVDIARVHSTGATSYYGTTSYDACPEIEDALPATGTANTRHDAVAGSGNSAKDYLRTPDGTGPWGGTATAAGSETICESNQGSGGGTFGLAKSPQTTLAATNSNFAYTLWAMNGSTAVSSPASVVVTDVLPTGVTFVSCTASPGTTSGTSSGPTGTCTHSSGTVTWTIGAMAANKQYKVALTVQSTTGGSKTNSISSNVGTGIPATDAIPVNIPVADYRFDETTWSSTAGDVKDASNTYNGTAVSDNGGLPTPTSSKVCNYGAFNPGYVSVPHNAALNPTNASFSFWIYPTASGGTYPIIAKYSTTAYDYVAYITSAGKLAFGWGIGLMPSTPNLITSATSIPLNQWTHAVVTFDATNKRQYIYLNGSTTPDVSGSVATGMTATSNPLIIGYAKPSTTTYRFSGRIDEVKIFSGVLSTTDIATIYSNENSSKNFDGTTRTCPSNGPDHYEVTVPSSNLACLASAVTVKACADLSNPCTNVATSVNGTATLGTSFGTLGATSLTFSSGVASTTLSYAAATNGDAATLTLSGESVAATNARTCCIGSTCSTSNTCAATFNTAGFIFTTAADGTTQTIANQTAGTTATNAADPTYNRYFLRAVKTGATTKACEAALTSSNAVTLGYSCNNPTSCTSGNYMNITPYNGTSAQTTVGLPSSGSSLTMYFDGNGNAPLAFNYLDAGNIALTASKSAGGSLLTSLSGSSSAFVVKPASLALSSTFPCSDSTSNPAAADASGSKFCKAGANFSAIVTARNSLGNATPNFGKESSPEGVTLTHSLVAPSGGATGTLANATITGGSFSAGVATVSTLNWNDVGIITLTPSIDDGNYLGAGGVSGTTSGNVGRFYAAQFALSGGVVANRTALSGCAAPAGCGTFTYMGEEMSAVFILTAQAVGGTKLDNYSYSATPANNFAKLDPTAGGNPLALAAVDTTVATLDTTTYGNASGNFTNGVATVTAPFAVTRGGTPYGPFDALDVGIKPVDSDDAALATLNLAVNAIGSPDTHGKVGTTKARYGRMKISNAHGSELLPLRIDVVAQYWNDTAYVTNALDDHSNFSATLGVTGVTDSNYQKNLVSGETAVIPSPASVVFDNGVASYRLLAPGAGNNGSLDMDVNVYTYLPSNTARATFGVYKGSNEIIYFRERY